MSATEDDTELRDLLIQNLENNGVLNKLKAEMRAAVFLAMEEQDKLENKSPLINENLKKCLNTKEGRLVAALIVDFLQVFNLDFTLAVFQPEINSLGGLENREELCRDLDLSQSDVNMKCPLLLELVKRGRHKQDRDVISSAPVSKIPRYKAPHRGQTAAQDEVVCLAEGDSQQPFSGPIEVSVPRRREDEVDEDEMEEEEVQVEEDEGDSFFDDPLPKPQKTYGWKMETPVARDNPAGFLSEAPGARRARGAGGAGGAGGEGGSNTSEQSHSRNEARESRVLNDKTGSLHLDDDIEYDDDFNSHRSDLSKSELSIGEEIEEVSIEGPDHSDKFDDSTQDLSVSQLSQSHAADYMEEVA